MHWRSLLRRKVRTLLTILGIAVGIAAIVALRSMASGYAAGMNSAVSAAGADLFVTQSDSIDITTSAVNEAVGERLLSSPDVDDVDPMLLELARTEALPYFMVYGYDPEGLGIRHFKIVEGVGLGPRPRGRAKEIIIGGMASRNLKKGVGDSIRIYQSVYRIVGIFETGEPMEEGGGVMTLPQLQQLSKKPHQVTGFAVRLKDVSALDEAILRLERRFPDLAFSTTSDFADKQEAVQMLEAFAWAIASLAILVGGIGMTNTILMSVFERTREIGTLRALGWSRSRVLRLIMTESLLLSLVGWAVGCLLGAAVVYLVGQNPALGGLMSGRLSLDLAVQALAIAIALGLIGGFYPSWWASRLSPLEALRYEGGGGHTVVLPFLPGDMAARNLFRRPIRTALTLVGISIGIATIVALQAISSGMIASFNRMVEGVDLVAVEADQADTSFSSIDAKVSKRIQGLPGVTHVSNVILNAVITPGVPYLILFGYHPSDRSIRHFKITEGKGLSATREIILGKKAAESLNKDIGETIRLMGVPYRVVGIFETGVGIEEGGGVISLREAQILFKKPRQSTMLSIYVEPSHDVEVVRKTIEERFPELMVSEASNFTNNLPDMQSMEAMVGGISALAILVGGIGMMNTSLMSMFERTREIGVLRALGWSKSRILVLVLRETAFLSALGWLMGLGLGIALVKLVESSPMGIEGTFTPAALAASLAIALSLGMLGGAYPAWRSARLDPLQALAFE